MVIIGAPLSSPIPLIRVRKPVFASGGTVTVSVNACQAKHRAVPLWERNLVLTGIGVCIAGTGADRLLRCGTLVCSECKALQACPPDLPSTHPKHSLAAIGQLVQY